MKLQDLNNLLNLPYKGEIELTDISLADIEELARYFGSEVKESIYRKSASFKRNDLLITLKTEIELPILPFYNF